MQQFRTYMFPCLGVLLAITILIGIIKDAPAEAEGIYVNWWPILSALIISYAILCFKIVGPDQIGCRLFLGKPIENLQSGPHLVVWPVEKIVTESKIVIQRQFPAEPEKVFEGDDDALLPPDKVRPIRVTHVGNDASADPLERSMTTTISMIVAFQIDNLVEFISTIGSMDNAFHQIQDMMTRTAQNELVGINVRQALRTKETVSNTIKEKTEGLISTWGVRMQDAYLDQITISKTLSKSLKDIPTAEIAARQTIIEAEALKKKTELANQAEAQGIKIKGLATADARKLLLEAEAVGYKKLASELGIQEGQVILAMESMKIALANANYSFIAGSSGMADALNMIPAIKQALSKISTQNNP